MRKLALGALALLTAAGCASHYGPGYERARGPHDTGYHEVRLDDNRYRVQYRVGRDGYGLAEDLAMRRAAELTREGGYDWFQIVGRNRAVSDSMFGRYEGGRYYDDPRRDYPPYESGYGDDVAMLEIVMGFDPPPRAASVYNARRVLDYGYGDRRYYRDRHDRARY